jgi:uncharacterized protein HemX
MLNGSLRRLWKTLWDWMQLLLIPVILAIGGFWLNQIQNERAQRTTQQQAELERELTRDNQHAIQVVSQTAQECLENVGKKMGKNSGGVSLSNVC